MTEPSLVAATTFPMIIADALAAGMSGNVSQALENYASRYHTDRWLLFSDYVLNQPGRTNDVFSFTLMPAGEYLATLTAEVAVTARRDFKDIARVNEPMMRLLTDERFFTLCLIVNPLRVLTRNVAQVRRILDRGIVAMDNVRGALANHQHILKLKRLRLQAASPSFNIRLLDNILLATSVASYLSYRLCAARDVTRLGWFSDRDSITAAHDAIANNFYAINVAGFCRQQMNGWPGPALGVNARLDRGPLWCDCFLRLPDYYAGMAAAWDFERDSIPATPIKYRQILADAIASHPTMHLLRMDFKHLDDTIAATATPIRVSGKTAGPTTH